MKNEKENSKEVLSENKIIAEFIGSLVNSIFKGKAKKLGKSFFGDPRLKSALDNYIKDTNEFKKELKRLGLGNTNDLKKALKGTDDEWVDY
tara:strand:+ start:510 stop:782 length:273 start_codon:yes stop_codon:yes gene_type:complete